MKQIVYLIFILFALSACKEVFEAPPQAFLKANLMNSKTNKTISSMITSQGIGIDSFLYKNVSRDMVLFPLSTKDTSRFLISFDSIIDTITFFHNTSMKYASMESGFYNEFKLVKIGFSRNRIDSILITDSLVTKTWHENIKLYIRPLPSIGN
jgi:hypothetical protein